MTSEKNYSDMTVNERLYEAGLLDDFYKAANRKDKNEMMAILMSVELDSARAEETAGTILNNMAFSGFES